MSLLLSIRASSRLVRSALLCGIALLLAAPVTAQQQQAQQPDESQKKELSQEMREQVLALPGQADSAAEGTLQFIGNATVLIRHAGFTILTDPNFLHKGEHAHLGYGLTSERLTEPAMALEDLPPIDLVVLSHMHGDHFDQLVQQKLNRDIPIVSTGQAVETLKELGFKSLYALDTWHSLRVTKGEATLRISAMPARHGPPVIAAALPETMGPMLEFSRDGKRGYRIYISGDTLIYDELKQIRERYPDIDLALLHLGGTRILGVLKVTMDGEDGVELMQIVVPRHAIPIHYNDYDVFKSPLSDFQKAVQQAGLQDKVTYLAHGERYRFKSRPR